MNDLVYFFAAPGAIGMFYLLYKMYEREWIDLTTEEIHKLWNENVDKFGTVEQFARDLERAIQEKNS